MADQPSKVGTKVDNFSNNKSTQNKPPVTQPKNQEKIPEIIGMPPFTTNLDVSKNLQSNSMIIASFQPCKPRLETGLTLFTLDTAWDKYSGLVKELGFDAGSGDSISMAFTADSLPSETFTNEYGESFLSSISEAMSGTAGEIVQMTGKEDAYSALKELNQVVSQMGALGSTISGGLSGIGNFASDAYMKAAAKNKNIEHIGRTMNKLLGGNRVDFPMIWKGSSFSTSYSINIRLYNPSPASKTSLNTYIVGPLAAILALASPISKDNGETYSYPFICRVNCPGLFQLNAAAITSVSVTKGGDNQLVGLNQIVGMLDVKIDLVSLHNSMVHTGNHASRPTLKTYLDNLRDSVSLKSIYGESATKKNIETSYLNKENTTPTPPVSTETTTTEPEVRINTDDSAIQKSLEALLPNFGDIIRTQ
jgi:hypothetical protein